MDTSPRDRITVDLQGLKGALMARAEADGVMPSQFVRQALAASLGTQGTVDAQAIQPAARIRSHRLCLRMRPDEVKAVRSSAALAGQRPGRWLARVAAGGAVGATAQQLDAQRTALVAVTAELAALRRVLQRLSLQDRIDPTSPEAEVLRQGLGDLRALLVSAASLAMNSPPVAQAPMHRTPGRSVARSAP
ncbi:hypothetical protein [Aquincola sp. J276]|uniref:hypothetical protein n=1 Tax=Aquincola sp. J276 TaxID=2898432 RepID=UPI0021516F7E|nr:hypothetical protein [Aquincola sp. J276]MCR5867633.1 hypothetical protein [Aquincola sp. J276]